MLLKIPSWMYGWMYIMGPCELASSSGVLGTKALSRHPSLQNALYVQLLAYLFPGTLLIPFMLEPLFTHLMSAL